MAAVPAWERLLLLGLTVTSMASGELFLEQPPRTPRVYAAAPSGVEVTTLRAVNVLQGARTPAHFPRYSLLRSNKTDYQYFNIDNRHGIIRTARYLERLVGHQYRVMVMVLASGKAEYKDLKITVTKYNQFAPVLALHHYRGEVVAAAGTGTHLLTVTATDEDDVEYNRDLRYFLADPSELPFTLNPFLDPPAWSPLRVDPRTGVVRVARDLQQSTSPLQLLVGAVDSGSPQRYSLANLTIYIRDMPAPRSVSVTNTSQSSLTVCWSPPIAGTPEGYILSYNPVDGGNSPHEGFLNLTTEQLHKTLSGSSNDHEAPTRGDGVVEVYRYCAVVGGLLGWTQYLVRVRAWAGPNISVATTSVIAHTTSDYCAEGVCNTGNCTLQKEPPGYSCHCPVGYYGDRCEQHNACLPDNPCHLGVCHNKTDGSYTCECLLGFYGPNCTLLDPCAAVPSNPCSNGGLCVSETSDQYECKCPEGYYGVFCEYQDPCLPKPCQHGASCTNLNHTTFLCVCPPGYTGKTCGEEIDECNPNPCKDGECTDLFNDYHCHCPRGWGGKNCEEDLDECASFPCLNGATCIDGQASYVCDCAHGYSGIRCGIPESCPAQTTLLSTGEFLWPATHHGESVTIACPYGIRIPAIEDRSTTETTTFHQLPATSPTNEDESLGFEQVVSSTEMPEVSRMTTTFAEWEGGSFKINRKTRDVYPSRATLFGGHEDSFLVKRQRILASKRGVSSRRPERRHHSHRESRKEGQSRHGRERQSGKKVEPFTRENERSTKRNPHKETHTDSKGERGQDKANQGVPENLKMGINPSTKPQTGQLSREEPLSMTKLMENTDESVTNPSAQDMPQVDPRLLRSKDENLGDTSNFNHHRKNKNIPENLTLRTDTTTELKDDSAILKNHEKKNTSGMHEKPGNLQVKRSKKLVRDGRAVRSCILLPDGNVTWREPDTSMCREEAMQVAEAAAEEVAILTASPSAVDSDMFTHAAEELAKLVDHAVKDPAVARNMVHALSNMMEVNESVVAAVDEQASVTKQLLNTINTFTENVPLEVGKPVKFGSQHLVVEARLLDSSLKKNVTFSPSQQESESSVQKRDITSSTPNQELEPYISLPPQALTLAGTRNVRLEFVSFANDKFFRGERKSGMPVIAAKITNTEVHNLSHPILYHIPLAATHTLESVRPVCVFWDEKENEWSSNGLKMVQIDGRSLCQTSHLTAFSILLDPLPAHLGTHAEPLSIITYIGLFLSTAALIATVATYALFRTLNRDRSGKIVMNLSLVLLLLNLVFIVAVNLKPPSVACMCLAAVLHYLVVAAFAWMLVEAANMYQLLITVFASAETHFMAKRVAAAWGVPVILVVIALAVDMNVYGDPTHGHCVISPMSNPALYYSTYLGPICLVLLVNCVVFVMVTRVLCQRRPRPNKPRAASSSASDALPITLAQVRGAVTVVALLGITWVAGALSLGGARLILQYLFCLTTPLQGLIIFIVRVAQHPEARAAWITLFTTGTLRRRPPTTHTHSTHSSGHTHSTLSTTNTPRNNHSSPHTTSTKISLRTSVKSRINAQKNGSVKSCNAKNGNISNNTPKNEKNQESESVMGTIFSHLIRRLSSSTHENENGPSASKKTNPDLASVTLPELECPGTFHQEQSYFCEAIPEKSNRSSNKKKSEQHPQSLVLLRTDSHGSVMATQSSTLSSQDCVNPQFPLLPSNFLPEELIEVGIPSSMLPKRSVGPLMLAAGGKEGDDSSWHFVRPPPDGHSDPVSEGESALMETDHNVISTKSDRECEKLSSQVVNACQTKKHTGCIVLSGQRIATNDSAISGGGKKNCISNLTRANSELHVNSSLINPADLRRSASVYTLGEWEDPRSSLA